MPKFFVEENQIKNNEIINICGSDINHIKNVLRKKIGNEIIVCNKSNSEDFLCEITKICDNNNCINSNYGFYVFHQKTSENKTQLEWVREQFKKI